ncbi:MAG: hypothetical protein ACKV0T_05720 [Planctomycetales bacterium]
MGAELVCRECGKRLPIDQAPPTVACPRCGALLHIVDPEADTEAWRPPGSDVMTAAEASGGSGGSDSWKSAAAVLDAPGSKPPTPDKPGKAGNRTTVYDLPPVSAIDAPPEEGTERGDDEGRRLVAAPSTESPSRETTATVGPSPPSRMATTLLISYASAVTLVCLYLAYLLSQRNPLLDLPDLEPPQAKKGQRLTLRYALPERPQPPSHTLRLGQSRRFGSVRVTPLRVTRGALDFEFFDPADERSRPRSAPVLKLHLRLDNVSSDQEFVALDQRLVFAKEPDKRKFGAFKANNFVCGVNDRAHHDRHVLVYDLSPESPWSVRGENLDRQLKPGDSVEVFIPTTEEGWDALAGDLVWRVHLRKGYNPQSLRGVTTLVEVIFNSSQITEDAVEVASRLNTEF